MELAGIVLLGILGFGVLVLVAGFLDTWWAQRKRKKEERGNG